MSVIYQKKVTTSAPTDRFSRMLHETQDFFAQKYRTNIIGKNFEDILTDDTLYNDYMNHITEGFEATEEAQIRAMADSTRENIITESLEGVQPYASLTMPILVKLWARLSLKYAVPTEPVTVPAFSVAFMKPYILGADGVTKHYLPEAINMQDNQLAELYQLPINAGFATNPDWRPGSTESPYVDDDGNPTAAGATDPTDTTGAAVLDRGEINLVTGKRTHYNLFTGSEIFDRKAVTNDARFAVDRKIMITDVFYNIAKTATDTPTPTPVKINVAVDLYRRFYGDVSYLT